MQLIKKGLFQAIAILGFWLLMIIPAFAYPEGTLISAESSSLKIYPQPNSEQPAIASGEGGDKVIILEKTYNNQGEIWDRIRLVNSPQVEGWLADNYIDQPSGETLFDDPYDPRNYYQPNQF